MKFSCERLVKAIDAYIQKADEDLEQLLEDSGYADPVGTVAFISLIEAQITAALNGEAESLLKKLNDAIDIKVFFHEQWPEFVDTDDLARTLFSIFHDELTTYMPQLVSCYIQETDPFLTTEKLSNKTSDWIGIWSKELSEKMKLDTHTQIEAILRKGLDEGQGVNEVAHTLSESGIRAPGYRARRVAITETLRAHSYSAQEALMQSPSVTEKEWVHTGSYRNAARENHATMNGSLVPKGEAFALEGADGVTYYPMFPRDSILPAGESVNCHCIHRGIASEKALGLSIEERRRLQAEAIAEMDDAWEKELDAKNKAKAGT